MLRKATAEVSKGQTIQSKRQTTGRNGQTEVEESQTD